VLAAGFLMLLTSLPETCASAEEVVRLYRLPVNVKQVAARHT
jgi:hypothetical protein